LTRPRRAVAAEVEVAEAVAEEDEGAAADLLSQVSMSLQILWLDSRKPMMPDPRDVSASTAAGHVVAPTLARTTTFKETANQIGSTICTVVLEEILHLAVAHLVLLVLIQFLRSSSLDSMQMSVVMMSRKSLHQSVA
jgi:hypothetical protein